MSIGVIKLDKRESKQILKNVLAKLQYKEDGFHTSVIHDFSLTTSRIHQWDLFVVRGKSYMPDVGDIDSNKPDLTGYCNSWHFIQPNANVNNRDFPRNSSLIATNCVELEG